MLYQQTKCTIHSNISTVSILYYNIISDSPTRKSFLTEKRDKKKKNIQLNVKDSLARNSVSKKYKQKRILFLSKFLVILSAL